MSSASKIEPILRQLSMEYGFEYLKNNPWEVTATVAGTLLATLAVERLVIPRIRHPRRHRFNTDEGHFTQPHGEIDRRGFLGMLGRGVALSGGTVFLAAALSSEKKCPLKLIVLTEQPLDGLNVIVSPWRPNAPLPKSFTAQIAGANGSTFFEEVLPGSHSVTLYRVTDSAAKLTGSDDHFFGEIAQEPIILPKEPSQQPITIKYHPTRAIVGRIVLNSFDWKKADITRDHSNRLKSFVERQPPGCQWIIEGHCDNTGDDPFNDSLGHRRAEVVTDAVTKLKINPSNIRTVSFGKRRLANSGPDDNPLNRRVEILAFLKSAI